MGFWDFFWLLVWSFFFVMCLMVLFHIISDLFRDNSLNGWLKALWIIALLVVPFLSALIYLIARGRGMAERQTRQIESTRAATDQYIQQWRDTATRPAKSRRRKLFSTRVPSRRPSSKPLSRRLSPDLD